MGATTNKGEIGEAMVLADLRRRGHGVAIPFGHDLPFDLILVRRSTGTLEKVQCKYTESDGRVIHARCASYSDWVSYRYTAELVDWLAVYDATSDRCYYIHSTDFDGRAVLSLRLEAAANGQRKRLRWAADHLDPDRGRARPTRSVPLPLRVPPE